MYNFKTNTGICDQMLFNLIAHYFSFKGPALSNALVNAGITTFQKISDTNPRELELV